MYRLVEQLGVIAERLSKLEDLAEAIGVVGRELAKRKDSEI